MSRIKPINRQEAYAHQFMDDAKTLLALSAVSKKAFDAALQTLKIHIQTYERKFDHIKEGDIVTRMLAGKIPMKLKVGFVDETFIYIGLPGEGGWKFRRDNGGEVDEDLQWDGITTGSYLIETD